MKYSINELNSNEFILYHHLGLGDHIICNGLVNYLSRDVSKIYLPVNNIFFEQIKYLYKHNDKVEVFAVNVPLINNADKDIYNFAIQKSIPVLRVGFEYEKNSRKPFYKAFYKQFNIRYKISYEYFQPPIDEKLIDKNYRHLLETFDIDNEDYILVHDESSVENFELKIDSQLKSVSLSHKYDRYQNIFLYNKIIRNAKEIHCVNSSFLHLIDRLETNGKLIYHDIRGSKVKLDKNWNFIKYENKY